ncbi:piggyBac transposable element-derived protein 4-like [Trichonephila clavipes]|uniref:PiggyBac transposable element-derived protein 4-like n=1 Tax=Trichonephila clavipes TaxID=2585209 RepID=A0A8X6S9G0_TRICX|nr:piggyBac transposable element-derived protein 4-like [Trichonephila clavipes]
MPNKPDKFGIKFWLATDVDCNYVLNVFPYLCKYEERPVKLSLSEYVVLRLIEPFTNETRNIITDHFFTTLILSQMLKTKNTSLTGTMKRNRKEVPECVKKVNMPLYDTLLLVHDDITLIVYKGEKTSKNVLLLSSFHITVDIGNNHPKKLPETISFYNPTKSGVGIADQMARRYSVKAGSRWWPIHVFSNILDLAGNNSWILYKDVTGKKLTRREYLIYIKKYIHKRKYKSDTQTKADTTEESAQMQIRVDCKDFQCRNETVDTCSDWINGECTKYIKRSYPKCA